MWREKKVHVLPKTLFQCDFKAYLWGTIYRLFVWKELYLPILLLQLWCSQGCEGLIDQNSFVTCYCAWVFLMEYWDPVCVQSLPYVVCEISVVSLFAERKIKVRLGAWRQVELRILRDFTDYFFQIAYAWKCPSPNVVAIYSSWFWGWVGHKCLRSCMVS